MTNPSRPMTLAELHEAVRNELGSLPTFDVDLRVVSRGERDHLRPILGEGSVEWTVTLDSGPIVSGPTPEIALHELRKALEARVRPEPVARVSERVGTVGLDDTGMRVELRP